VDNLFRTKLPLHMKKTIVLSNPAYLRSKFEQMIAEFPEKGSNPRPQTSIPIEDIGFLILENPQITITHQLLGDLMSNGVAIISCDQRHMPNGIMLALEGNSLQSQRFRMQLSASSPLKKQLWQQTIKQKIANQAALLQQLKIDTRPLQRWQMEVRSGDPDNLEARAAAWYWPRLFNMNLDNYENSLKDFDLQFIRQRAGEGPNRLLDYGYAILRAVISRALAGAGLMLTLGIHHRNQYNAYCLADDIMEPYRPIVDGLVWNLHKEIETTNLDIDENILTPEVKRRLLVIPVLDVKMGSIVKPLQHAAQKTAATLVSCFAGESRRIEYPTACF